MAEAGEDQHNADTDAVVGAEIPEPLKAIQLAMGTFKLDETNCPIDSS